MVTFCRQRWVNMEVKTVLSIQRKGRNNTPNQKALIVHTLSEALHLTYMHTHAHTVCWWAERVGEGLGGWYKASLKYKHQATTTEPFQHCSRWCMGNLDLCRTQGWCNYLSFGLFVNEMMVQWYNEEINSCPTPV